MRSALDAQPDSGYYDSTFDFIPSIDSACKWIFSIIVASKSRSKRAAEILREAQFNYIYVTNIQSRIMIEGAIWSIDAVFPLPFTISNGQPTPPPPLDDFESYVRTDLVYQYSNYSAYRKTVEQTGENRNNPFSPGYNPPTISQSQLVEGSNLNIDFCYIEPYSYNTQQENPMDKRGYIEIQPFIPKKMCAVAYTINPNPILGTGTNINLPDSAFLLIVEKALSFLSYQQGDKTTLYQVTEVDIQRVLSSI